MLQFDIWQMAVRHLLPKLFEVKNVWFLLGHPVGVRVTCFLGSLTDFDKKWSNGRELRNSVTSGARNKT